MTERDKKIISEFKQRLAGEMPGDIKNLIVFGSRARGVAAEESDLDMVALVTYKSPEIEKNWKILRML